MEKIDSARAAAVWQRVRGTPPAPGREQALPQMIQEALVSADIYTRLSRQYGAQRARLEQMARTEAAHAACLKGVCWVLTGRIPAVGTPASPLRNPEAELRRCCARQARCIARYEQWCADPEFGSAFSELVRQARAQYILLLSVIGSAVPAGNAGR